MEEQAQSERGRMAIDEAVGRSMGEGQQDLGRGNSRRPSLGAESCGDPAMSCNPAHRRPARGGKARSEGDDALSLRRSPASCTSSMLAFAQRLI